MKKKKLLILAIISAVVICSAIYTIANLPTKNTTNASENTPAPRTELIPIKPTQQQITYEEYKGSNEWMTKPDFSETATANGLGTINMEFYHEDIHLLFHIENNGQATFDWKFILPNEQTLAKGSLQPGEKQTYITSTKDLPVGLYKLYSNSPDGREFKHTLITKSFPGYIGDPSAISEWRH